MDISEAQSKNEVSLGLSFILMPLTQGKTRNVF